jgi:coenzyme F420-dependent glucose-6-phosphate dehydrogenase
MRIGYAAMLEQFAPAEVIASCVAAERAGFDGVMATDHFQPWLPHHGEASHVWTMLGAIGAHIQGDLGPAATTPTFRTHPAVVAQAAATLAALYPGRVWLGVGSGDALNEHVVGDYWPEAGERIDHMFEAYEVIRKLFAATTSGRSVRHRGTRFRMESTRLWTRPATPPPLYVATGGPITARRAGRVADGIVTTGEDPDRIARVLDRFDQGVRESGRDPATTAKVLQLHLAWAPTQEEAEADALAEWPMVGLRIRRSDIRSPHDFEQLVRSVRAEDLSPALLISADPDEHRARIQRFADMGFTRIYLHNVGRRQREWIDVFGRDVLPQVRA